MSKTIRAKVDPHPKAHPVGGRQRACDGCNVMFLVDELTALHTQLGVLKGHYCPDCALEE